MSADDLHQLRSRVHAVLGVALVVSVAANVIAAQPTIIGRAVAGWFPIALLLVVDVLGKAPPAPDWLGRISITATALVAGAAAVASFTHMRHVAQTAGESALVAVLFPLSVDGAAIVASIALVEINRRTNTIPDSKAVAPHHPASTGTPHIDSSDLSTDAEPDTPPAVLPVFTRPVSTRSPALNGQEKPTTERTTE